MKAICKIVAVLLTLCLLTGCGPAPTGPDSTPAGPQAANTADLHVYSWTETDPGMTAWADSFGAAALAGDRIYATGYRFHEGQSADVLLLTAPLADGEVTQLPLPLHTADPDNGKNTIRGLAAAPDGGLCVLEAVHYSGSDATGRTDRHSEFYLHRLAADGTALSVTAIPVTDSAWLAGNCMVCAADGTVYIPAETALIAAAPDGAVRTVPVDATGNGYIHGLTATAAGDVLVSYYGGAGWEPRLARLQNGELTEELPLPNGMENATLIADSADRLYFYNSSGIYAYDPAAGSAQLLCSWLDSGIRCDQQVHQLAALTDGSFVAVGLGENGDKLLVTRLTPADPATLGQKTVLTLGATYDPGTHFQNQILEFNRRSDTVQVTVKDYSIYDSEENDWTGATQQLNIDIISGNAPDILLVDSTMPFASYTQKGLFADLTPLLDDPASPVKREELLPGVLTACQVDGQLVSIVPSFYIQTIAGRASDLGDEPGWTWDDFFAALDANPTVPAALAYGCASDVLTRFLVVGGSQFVNTAAGTCRFDSPDFIRLLEHCAAYPVQPPANNWGIDEEKAALAAGDALLVRAFINRLTDVGAVSYQFDGDFVFKGCPTPTGTGGSVLMPDLQLAISESCADKAAAWQFVCGFFSDEYLDTMWWGIPATHSALQTKADCAADPDNFDGGLFQQGYEEQALTPAELQAALELVNSTTILYHYDAALMDIVLEEAAAFFAGDKTAAEAAQIIQNRAATYLAESR